MLTSPPRADLCGVPNVVTRKTCTINKKLTLPEGRRSRDGQVRENQADLFRQRLVSWAKRHGRHHLPWRRKSGSIYQKIVAEALLQRTRAETVAQFFVPFIERFSSWSALANAHEQELQDFLRPIGLWRRRSESLKGLAIEMVSRHGRFPRDRVQVEALPGVGQYIANAILVICHRDPHPLLDTNMARVLERYFGSRKLADIRYDPYLQELASKVVRGPDPLIINWAILDFAALVCKPRKPVCHLCPISSECDYFGAQTKSLQIALRICKRRYEKPLGLTN
jgi:A/G-specific adenine glycosylase